MDNDTGFHQKEMLFGIQQMLIGALEIQKILEQQLLIFMYPSKIQVKNAHMTICDQTGGITLEMNFLKLYLILSEFIVLKVIAKINQL